MGKNLWDEVEIYPLNWSESLWKHMSSQIISGESECDQPQKQVPSGWGQAI